MTLNLCFLLCMVSFSSAWANREPCTDSECATYCPAGLPSQGNIFGRREDITVEPVEGVARKNCLCQCAVPENEDCDEDGDCASGYVCGARKDVGSATNTKGICTSRCRFFPCEPEETCAIVNGERTCLCKTFECAGDSDDRFSKVCAEDSANTLRTFANECQFLSKNCEEKTAKKQLLRRLAVCPIS